MNKNGIIKYIFVTQNKQEMSLTLSSNIYYSLNMKTKSKGKGK